MDHSVSYMYFGHVTIKARWSRERYHENVGKEARKNSGWMTLRL